MTADGITWIIYRDDRMDQLEKARACMAAYARKLQQRPNRLGVNSRFPKEAAAALEKEGVKVICNLPAWQRDEVWVGYEA